ncbi:MAG: hypothetical protein ACWA5A_17330 [Marinibacterium sp.]
MKRRSSGQPTPEKVARYATKTIDWDADAPMLIGIFGPEESLSALVRMPGGRIRQLTRGGRFHGGKVVGVDPGGLSFVVGARTRRLPLTPSP